MFEKVPGNLGGVYSRFQFIYDEVRARMEGAECKEVVKILDIGCGTGEYTTIPLGCLRATITGIDIHLPTIEYACKKNTYKNVHFHCTSVDGLGSQRFDFIICSALLEHLNEPSKMLNSIKRLLKPYGTCIIAVPNGYSPHEIESRLYNILEGSKLLAPTMHFLRKLYERLNKNTMPKDTLNNTDSPHVQFFSCRQLENLVEGAGFSIVKKKNWSFLSSYLLGCFLRRSRRMVGWSIGIADKLPNSLASGWTFVIVKKMV